MLLKKLNSVLLQIALLMPVFTGVIKVLTYAIEFKEYQAQCINRDIEEISCNGLCKLGSELSSEARDTESQIPAIPSIENLIPLFYSHKSEPSNLTAWTFISKNLNSYSYIEPVSESFINELIKPPTLV